MNVGLLKMSIWFKANKLSLNLTKTKWTLFHSQKKKRLITNGLPMLYIDNFEIVRESITKFLGIFIDGNLTWKNHIEHVCTKVSKSIRIMYKSRNILSKRLMKQLYFSFIYSYLNYANITWASTNKSNLISIYRHQKHAVRIIYDKDRFAHTKPLFKHAKTLTVYEINLLQILSLTCKCKNRTAPFVFHDLYTLKPLNRTGNLLFIPLKRTKFGQFSIYFRGPYLWIKNLAQKTFICNLEYYPLFKNRLKGDIFSLNDATLYF